MTHRPRTMLALAFALQTLTCVSAMADRGRDRWRDAIPESFAPQTVADKGISKEDAIKVVLKKYGGKVLDAQDQGDTYQVKVVGDDSVVRKVTVDAATGKIR